MLSGNVWDLPFILGFLRLPEEMCGYGSFFIYCAEYSLGPFSLYVSHSVLGKSNISLMISLPLFLYSLLDIKPGLMLYLLLVYCLTFSMFL